MAINIDTLLTLPQKERRKIAEELWKSLSPTNSVTKEEKEIIMLLEKRWEKIQTGESKLYTPNEMRQMVVEHRNKK